MSNNSDTKNILPRPLRIGELLVYAKVSDIYDFSECGDTILTADDTLMEVPTTIVTPSAKKNNKKRSYGQISSTTPPSS